MESHAHIALYDALPTRAPLLEKPNSPPPSPVKQVRRKSSFIRRIDSSEEYPSPHDSIFEACRFSSDESFIPFERIQMADLQNPKNAGLDITISIAQNHSTIQNMPSDGFRYGNGTILDTITEQKSCGTMRSLYCPSSVDDSKAFLGHRDSFIVAKSPRRKHSFSLNDLHPVGSYHGIIHEIYASPKAPVRDPIERPSTPSGMPSWTAAQTPTIPLVPQRSYHIPGAPNQLQRFLGIEPSGITFSSRVPTPPLGVVSSPTTPTGSRTAPRFRPPRSAYGALTRHPFNNCPVAPLPQTRLPSSKKVRFAPSATARDSSELNLRNAMDSTTASALHPMTSTQIMAPVLPDPQASPATPKQKLCLHRKKPAIPANLVPINVETCITVESRHNSVSSTAHLMSGALTVPSHAESGLSLPVIESGLSSSINGHSPETHIGGTSKIGRFVPCWKCIFEKWTEKAEQFWAQTTSCFCFVCCGYEYDGESVIAPYGEYGYATGSGYFDNEGMDCRRTALEQTPASMI